MESEIFENFNDTNLNFHQLKHALDNSNPNYSPTKESTILYEQIQPVYYLENEGLQQNLNEPRRILNDAEIRREEDLDMIANLIAKDNLFMKPNNNIGNLENLSNNHRINDQNFMHPNNTNNGTPQSRTSSSTPGDGGDDNNNSSLRAAAESNSLNNNNLIMHTLHTSQMHHLQQQQQQQQQQASNSSQSQHQQTQQQPNQLQQPQGSGLFHGMYHPAFDMSNIFGMSQINGHLQNVSLASQVPQMTIAFTNGPHGPPTMVQHIPTHIQVPLPPPSTSNASSTNNNGTSSATTKASTTTTNRQNSNGSTSSSASRSRNRTSSGDMVKCNFCPKKISTNMADAHRNECRMIRCHECPQCGKRFKARGGLQQHSRIHLIDRAYGCKFCDKRFTQKSHLDQHERIHTGAKPFVCQFCGRGFRQRSQQIGHEATHPAGSSGIFSVNTTGSDQSSVSDNSCGASPANSTLPLQTTQEEQQNKVLQLQMAQNNVAMLNMLNNTTPTNGTHILNLKMLSN